MGLVAAVGAAVVLGCMDRTVTGPTPLGVSDSLRVVSGSNQSGIISTALPTAVVVQVKNAAGAVIKNATVTFSVASGGGSVSPAIMSTDATGSAQTTWTLGSTTGQQSLTASAGSNTVTIVATAAASASSGGGTTTTQTPTQVALSQGAGQSGTIGQPLGIPIVAKVLDAGGNTVAGVDVVWSTPVANGTGSFASPVTSRTDAAGLATTTWILGSKVGQQLITATVGSLTPLTLSATAQLGTGGAILIDNGNNQSANISAALPTYLRVLVVDQNGNPALGARVTWNVQSGGGTLSKANGTTNAAGLDSIQWTFGPTAGQQAVSAQVSNGTFVTFFGSANTLAATPAQVVIGSGNGQLASIGQPAPLPVVVKVLDANGGPVSGTLVSFTPAAGNGGGSTSPAFIKTDAAGLATTEWILGSKVGQQTLQASVSGLTPLSLVATASVGAGGAILIDNGNNQSANASSALPNYLRVLVLDGNGNPAQNARVSWLVTQGAGSISQSNGATSAAGKDSVSWTLGSSGTQNVTATVNGIGFVTFVGNVTTGSLVPSQIVVASGNGQSGSVGQPLAQPVMIKVVDASATPVSGVTVNFTLPVGNGGGSVSPSSGKTDASGQLSTLWTLGSKVGQQTINASVTGLTTLSMISTATLNSSGAVLVDNGNNQAGGSGGTLTNYLRTLVVDQGGNPVLGARVSWAVASGGGTLSKTTGTTNAVGVDSVQWTLGSTVGAQTVTATVQFVGAATFTATASTTSGVATTLRIVSGDGQSGQSAQVLPLPLVVEVRDAGGNALSGVAVSFTQAAGNSDGVTSPSPTTTGVDGRASVTWRLGTNTGSTVQTQTVTAALTAFPAVTSVSFTASARPQFRIRMVDLKDTLQVDTTGATLKDSLLVQVYDPVTNKGVQGVPVTWGVQSGTSVDGFPVIAGDTTDNNGYARTRWVLRSSASGAAIPPSVVSKRMVATATGVGQVEFKARVYPGSLRAITLNLPSTSQTAGTTASLCATALDGSSYPVDSANTTITVVVGGVTTTYTDKTKLDGTVCANHPVTTSGSMSVTFSITSTVRPYTFTASDSKTGSVVAVPGNASTVVIISGNNQSGTAGRALAAPLIVEVRDAFGNTVSGASVAIAVVGGAGTVTVGGGGSSNVSTTSGGAGRVSFSWTLGAAAGTNTVSVIAGGTLVTFTATGT